MEKEKVEKWFNRLAKATKTLHNTEPLGELRTCISGAPYRDKFVPYVHIYEGLHEAAELLGLEEDLYQEDDEYKWYGIVYKDVLFFQLDSKGE